MKHKTNSVGANLIARTFERKVREASALHANAKRDNAILTMCMSYNTAQSILRLLNETVADRKATEQFILSIAP